METLPPNQLIDAARAGYTKKVSQLIELGEDVNAMDSEGKTTLMVAIIEDKDIEKLTGIMAWFFYRKSSHFEIIKLLLAAKADVNVVTNDGRTALMEAAQYGRTKVVKQLLTANADVNAKGYNGWTALMWAAFFYAPTKEVKLLLDANAHLNTKDNEGWTALMYAATFGRTEMVKLLLAAKADVNAVATDGGYKGQTARQIAKDAEFLDAAILMKRAGGK